MSAENLTRAEAAHRADLMAIDSYVVTVDLTGRGLDGSPLDDPETTFVSSSTVGFHAAQAARSHLDLIGEAVLTADLDGEPLDPETFTGSRLPFRVGAGDHLLSVTSLMRFSRVGAGLHRFVDPADSRVYLYTQFEVSDARRVFGCFEQPDLKARFLVSVSAPAHWTVISNATATVPTPLSGGEFGRWDFDLTAPMSTYLVGIVAGEYHRVTREARSAAGELPMSVLCRESVAESLDADRILDATLEGFAVFEEHFDYPYPFRSYDQAFVPEYNMGAMENVGCVTLRDDYVFRSRVTQAAYRNRDNTIWHELAHMWFGDLVTMVWWDDLWLKESFAEWSSTFAMSKIGPDADAAWAMFCNARKTWAYRADQLPTTHPIAADMVDLDAVETNFDGITYAKGASVLRQLVAYVGEDDFLAGVRRYFVDHAYGNTRLGDLLAALERASGRDLSGWSAQWLEAAGVNTMHPVIEESSSGLITRFAVEQTAPDQWPTLRDHRIAIGLYELTDGELHRVGRVETDVSGSVTEVDALVGVKRPDLVLLNDDDLSYTKIRLDPRSLATLLDGLPTLGSALTRAVCWSALWDMTRDAELSPAAYQDVALPAVGRESDPSCVQSTVSQLLTAAEQYVALADRPAQLAELGAGLLRLLGAAEPGSDHQLTFARGYAASATSPEAARRLTDWLVGTDVPDGLVVDTDLRWSLVRAAARVGALDGSAIDAELGRDHTIAGAQAAAGARAAMPTAEAKAWAWTAAVDRDDVPNETQRSICLSFWQRDQEEALDGYADRYLALAQAISDRAGVWADRGLALRTNALRYLFPPVKAVPDIVERFDRWLGDARLNPSERRIVVECRADAARALRCRAAA
ncbi:MAG: aminopeptidase N [Propionibacteriaceae bacterium]